MKEQNEEAIKSSETSNKEEIYDEEDWSELSIDYYAEQELRHQVLLNEANEIHEQLDNVAVDLLNLEDMIDSGPVKECSAYVRLALVALEKEL